LKGKLFFCYFYPDAINLPSVVTKIAQPKLAYYPITNTSIDIERSPTSIPVEADT
jgi:hypothetical protein